MEKHGDGSASSSKRFAGNVPPSLENFFNYIKINKELRDLDLKKNLDAKNALIEQANALLEDNNIGNAFRQLQSLHSQWKEIGPVAKEVQEEHI